VCSSDLNNSTTVQFLLNNGANIRATNNEGDTPLHLACAENSWEIVLRLLDKGADVHLKNIERETPA
jgi:ankyrin repeat protein